MEYVIIVFALAILAGTIPGLVYLLWVSRPRQDSSPMGPVRRVNTYIEQIGRDS